MDKMGWDGPKWGREDFFLLTQTLPTFGTTGALFFIIFIISLESKFLYFQVPRFPDTAGAARRTLRSQLDPSSNATRDQIRRGKPLLRQVAHNQLTQQVVVQQVTQQVIQVVAQQVAQQVVAQQQMHLV